MTRNTEETPAPVRAGRGRGRHGGVDVAHSTPFEARFAGPCTSGCGIRIRPGDLIFSDVDGYHHAECGDHLPRDHRPVPVCSSCFLERPCPCEDDQ